MTGSAPYMGRWEIAVRLGVTRSRVYAITKRPDFPTPWRLVAGDVWATADVEAWAREHWPAPGGEQ